MPTPTCDWYQIVCLTNLHAGRGDTNYDIVDKEVQRDPIEELPIIHASSLKGAFREWFRGHFPSGDSKDHPTVNAIFGNDTKGSNTKFGQGSHQFFEARLLALPVRSNQLPYLLATSPELVLDCLDQLAIFGVPYRASVELKQALKNIKFTDNKPLVLTTTNTSEEFYTDEFVAQRENNESLSALLKNLLDFDHIALFPHTTLKEVAKRLPVLARNNLENGRSVNLWYEEIVPRQTRFSFFVRHNDADNTFANTLAAKNGLVQIGANATIGYGQCKLVRNNE